MDRYHLSCVWLLSSASQRESGEELGELRWDPGRSGTLQHCLRDASRESWTETGPEEKTGSLGVLQSRTGCEVRGPDSFVVETPRTRAHAA